MPVKWKSGVQDDRIFMIVKVRNFKFDKACPFIESRIDLVLWRVGKATFGEMGFRKFKSKVLKFRPGLRGRKHTPKKIFRSMFPRNEGNLTFSLRADEGRADLRISNGNLKCSFLPIWLDPNKLSG